MTSTTAAPAAVALYCDQCDQPATQEIDWIELTDTLDERGNSTTVCDSHVCWAAATELIEDEFAGKVQQTRRTTPPNTRLHRRNHDIPETVTWGGDYRPNGDIVSLQSVRVACFDCGRWYDPADNVSCIPNARRMAGLPPLSAAS